MHARNRYVYIYGYYTNLVGWKIGVGCHPRNHRPIGIDFTCDLQHRGIQERDHSAVLRIIPLQGLEIPGRLIRTVAFNKLADAGLISFARGVRIALIADNSMTDVNICVT